MWTTDQIGLATWTESGSSWSVDARGGKHGIGVLAADAGTRYVSLTPVDQNELPLAGEQFVRGDQLHLNYPQGDGLYAIRLVLQPIVTETNLLVLEAMISIQTDLLDSHPKVDIDIDCQSIDSIVPSDLSGDDEVEGAGSAPISLAANEQHCCSVLLGPHDRPFTTNHSTDSLLRLRLFGEFLEKGVIRRGRPWIVIDRSGTVTSEDRVQSLWQQLCESPVPLT
jgi:hypothetical protein